MTDSEKAKQYAKLLDTLSPKGSRALFALSKNRHLQTFCKALCDACEEEEDVETHFGKTATAADLFDHFIQRHRANMELVEEAIANGDIEEPQ